MGQPVVLPKFDLPGDKPHWAVRAAWIVGGLLLVSIVGLVAVMIHHRNLVTQAQIARVEAIAKVKAEAEAKVAAAAAIAKAQREAELAAKAKTVAATQAVPATTVPGAAVPGDGAAAQTAPKPVKAHRFHAAHGARASKGGAKTVASKPEGRSVSTKPDAIDELLKRMK